MGEISYKGAMRIQTLVLGPEQLIQIFLKRIGTLAQ